jgi:hypothetical protein
MEEFRVFCGAPSGRPIPFHTQPLILALALLFATGVSTGLSGKPKLSNYRKKSRNKHGNFARTSRGRGQDLSICRGHLLGKVTEWLVGLLGKIAVQCANLRRLGYECLVSGLREFGLNFNHLVERSCARELLNKRLCAFKRFFRVVCVSSGNRLKAACEGVGWPICCTDCRTGWLFDIALAREILFRFTGFCMK